MKIILSPAKKMREVDDFEYQQLPKLLDKTQILKKYLATLSVSQLSEIMKCNEKIAQLNYERYQTMNLKENLSCALFTYVGLAYQHLAPDVMTYEELNYLQQHLFILSGFYGVLRPFDGISCYRLEMQTKLNLQEVDNLYDFWKDSIANEVYQENDLIINLASKEYSSCITPYLNEHRKMITIHFVQEVKGQLKTKGTEAKMCRGAMVRYMASHQVEDIELLKAFEYLGYQYDEKLSTSQDFVFKK